MKKYSSDFFEKKFRILSDRLLSKNGFQDMVREIRKELSIPTNGFNNESEFAQYLIGKMSKEEQRMLTFSVFMNEYLFENKIRFEEADREKVTRAFLKKYKNGIDMAPMMFELSNTISDHVNFLTQFIAFDKNRFLSMFFPKMIGICKKFWGIDMLDQHIMTHLVEKYLFLGNYGINEYIRRKVICPNCRYIGVEHFSPNRNNMEGQDEGPFSKKYIFNKTTIKRLSSFFDSVFLIIRPYASKEEVLSYIEDNWGDLKEHVVEKNTYYKQLDFKGSRIKESDLEKNQLIYELNKLSKGDLLKIYKGEEDLAVPGLYKESVISKILKSEYDIEMTPDAIKKSATRFAQSIHVKNKPKDIMDI